jgi:hypothetical protein
MWLRAHAAAVERRSASGQTVAKTRSGLVPPLTPLPRPWGNRTRVIEVRHAGTHQTTPRYAADPTVPITVFARVPLREFPTS